MKLKRLDLSHHEFEIGVEKSGSQVIFQLVKKLHNIDTGEIIDNSNLIFLLIDSCHLVSDEIGLSKFGMGFNVWEILRIDPKTIAYTREIDYEHADFFQKQYEHQKRDVMAIMQIIENNKGRLERIVLKSKLSCNLFEKILGKKRPRFSTDSNYKFPNLVFLKDNPNES